MGAGEGIIAMEQRSMFDPVPPEVFGHAVANNYLSDLADGLIGFEGTDIWLSELRREGFYGLAQEIEWRVILLARQNSR